jgi:hypothetical protein
MNSNFCPPVGKGSGDDLVSRNISPKAFLAGEAWCMGSRDEPYAGRAEPANQGIFLTKQSYQAGI